MNNSIFLKLYNFSHQSVFFDQVIYFVSHILPFIVIAFAVVFLIFHKEDLKSLNILNIFTRKLKEVFYVFLSSISAWCVATFMKIIVKSPRPYLVFPDINPILLKTDFSFPSGHATFFMALGVSIYLSHKKAGIVFITLAFIIGISRVIAGVHFPIDILGGFIIGFLVAYFLKRL